MLSSNWKVDGVPTVATFFVRLRKRQTCRSEALGRSFGETKSWLIPLRSRPCTATGTLSLVLKEEGVISKRLCGSHDMSYTGGLHTKVNVVIHVSPASIRSTL